MAKCCPKLDVQLDYVRIYLAKPEEAGDVVVILALDEDCTH